MKISEEQLRQLVWKILKKLEEESKKEKKLLYMVCTSAWDERYETFLEELQLSGQYRVCPVIPDEWQESGLESRLKGFPSCTGIRCYSQGIPKNLEEAVTAFPVVSTEAVVKTALCIQDTFETSWVAACFREGSRVLFMQTGLTPFSGKEQPAYQDQILSYYRKILEYGVEICSCKELCSPVTAVIPDKKTEVCAAGPKRVITASTVEQYASDGVLTVRQGDIITDMAKDRARVLNIALQETKVVR